MEDENKHNILYFENSTMHALYEIMEKWQNENHKRFLSLSIQQDKDMFCCIALTNPTEVVITDPIDGETARVSYRCLQVR